MVIAAYQRTGRGQAGNIWESEPGRNLLLSLLITPDIEADQQVYLNLVACLSVYDLVNAYCPGRTFVKWPNDIYVGNRKVAGILIENSLQGSRIKSSILGIGINLNQAFFSIPKAISLATLTGHELDPDQCLNELQSCLNKRYEMLSLHLKQRLMDDYLAVLYRKGEQAHYRVNGQVIEGEITGIDPAGRLQLKTADGTRLFAFKEIEYV